MKNALPRALALAAAFCSALLPAAAADEFPVFRYRTSLSGGGVGSPPDGGGASEPTDPLAGPTTHLRVTVSNFGDAAAGALSELAFAVGTTRLAPKSAAISGNTGTGEANAFDGNVGTAWAGASGVRTATFVYEIPAGASPDHLEIVATGANAPSDFLIERSPNALSYIPVVSYSGERGWAAGEKRRYPFTLAAAPSSPSSDAHKYWRFVVDRFNPNSYDGVGEVVFKDASGRDVTTGGKATSSHSGGGRAFDKSVNSEWLGEHRVSTPSPWFQYEFAEPQALASFDLGAAGGVSGAPQRFRVESSDDGRAWKPEGRYIGQGKWASGEVRNYPLGFAKPAEGHHQFWRVSVLKTRSSEGDAAFNDLNVYTADGASQIGKAVEIASSSLSAAHTPDWASDGAMSNAWRSRYDDPAPWMGYTFPQPIKADHVKIWAHDHQSPQDLAIDWSDDGDTWTRAATYTGNGNWKGAEPRLFSVAGPGRRPADHHKHWRVFVESTENASSTSTQIQEITFLDQSGSPIPKRGAASAGSQTYSGSASMAFDGEILWYSYYWQSEKPSDWVAYEFPEWQRPSAVQIAARTTDAPNAFRVEWSDDGKDWTTAIRRMGNGGWNGDTRTFPLAPQPKADGEHQFWRLNVKALDGANAHLAIPELDFVAADGADRQVKGASFASSRYSTSIYLPGWAFDNDASSVYYSAAIASTKLPQTIGYAFPQPVAVNEVRLMALGDGSAPRDFDIEWSDDGETWTLAESYANSSNWKAKEVRVFPIPKPQPGFEESHGYAINMRQIVPQGFTGTVSPMTLNGVRLVGADGQPVPFQGLPSVKYHLDDQTISRAFDDLSYTEWAAREREARIDIGLALPLRVTDFQSTVNTGCAGCEVEMILYRFIGPEETGTRDEVSKRTVR